MPSVNIFPVKYQSKANLSRFPPSINCAIWYVLFTAASVKFLESSYRTNEKSNVQLMLALSNPSSTDVIVNIQSKDTSATGMYMFRIIVANYIMV